MTTSQATVYSTTAPIPLSEGWWQADLVCNKLGKIGTIQRKCSRKEFEKHLETVLTRHNTHYAHKTAGWKDIKTPLIRNRVKESEPTREEITAAAIKIGITAKSIRRRVSAHGYTWARALTEPYKWAKKQLKT